MIGFCNLPDFSYSPAYKVLVKKIYALFKYPHHSFRANPVTKMDKITQIKWRFVLKKYFFRTVLPIRIFQVSLHNYLISKTINLLKQQ